MDGEEAEDFKVKMEPTEDVEPKPVAPTTKSPRVIKAERVEPQDELISAVKEEKKQPAFSKVKKSARVINKDVCAICLSNFLSQETGTPDVCLHQFCLECIQQWALVS